MSSYNIKQSIAEPHERVTRRYFDKKNCRIVYIGQLADDNFWNQHWNNKNINIEAISLKNRLLINLTKKYLPKGSKILEGGCGMGANVYALYLNDYDAYGLDYAQEAVVKVKNHVPDLNVQYGDVRNLPYHDNFFDGYWSLGVIEHFYNDFNDILNEAHRVLKVNGYLFLCFPYMNFIRRIKGFFNVYPSWEHPDNKPEQFYQFALKKQNVINAITDTGFCLVYSKPFDGVKGLKDEVHCFHNCLQNIYDNEKLIVRIIRKFLNLGLAWFSAHSILLIFKKTPG